MAKKFDFDDMSVDELWLLHEKIGRLLSVRLTEEKRALEKRLAQLSREREPPPARLNEAETDRKQPGTRRAYPQVFPKYRNSEEPFETWSGRGRQPLWLTAALRKGHKIEDFIIRVPGRDKAAAARKRS